MDTIYSNHWNISTTLNDHLHHSHHHQSDLNQFNLPATESGSSIDCVSSPLASILSDGSVFNLLNSVTGCSNQSNDLNNLSSESIMDNNTTSQSLINTTATNITNDFMISSFGLLDGDFNSDQSSCDFSTLHPSSPSTNATSYNTSNPLQSTSPTTPTPTASTPINSKQYQSNGKIVCKSIPVNCLSELYTDINKVFSSNSDTINSNITRTQSDNCHPIPDNLYIHHIQPHHIINNTSSGHSSGPIKRSLITSTQSYSTVKEVTKNSTKRQSLDSENRRRNHHHHHHTSSSSSSSSTSSTCNLTKLCDTIKINSRSSSNNVNCDLKILSPEDEERRRRRRERNKVAATKCRNKKKFHVFKLCQESQILETTNRDLKEEIQSLEREQQQLKSIFQKHLPYCSMMTFQT